MGIEISVGMSETEGDREVLERRRLSAGYASSRDEEERPQAPVGWTLLGGSHDTPPSGPSWAW